MNDRVQKLEASTEFAEEMLVAEIQSVLQEILEEKGYSRADLAKKMGVTKARVTQIFSDTQNFTVRLVARAFHALGEKITLGHAPLNENRSKCDEREGMELAHYLVTPPVISEHWLSSDWQRYKGGIFVAGWPESEDFDEALASFIDTQMHDPRALKGHHLPRSERPQSVAEWVRPSNVLPLRKERACA